MRIYLLILFSALCFSGYGQSVQGIKGTIIHDTIIIHDTVKTVASNSDTALQRSEYYSLFEKLLEQKQVHYDSSLNTLNFYAGLLAVIFTIIVIVMVLFGVHEFRQMRNDLNLELVNRTQQIESNIHSKLKEEAEKIANDLITKKYEQDITDLKEKVSNVEGLAQEITEAYVLRYEKEKPELKEIGKEKRTNENPFG